MRPTFFARSFGIFVFACSISIFSLRAQDIVLETLGVSSGQAVYLTYVAMGTVVDAYNANAYDTTTATQMLTNYMNMSEAAANQYKKLIEANLLTEEDQSYVVQLSEIYQLLYAEASAFKSYIEGADETYLTIYDARRNEAWTRITGLLGVSRN
ncbi:MAG: hypothetical protein SF053_02055 [Bacteroidia bacterium]|nr:hypothetical protein [Bacteroidia bacterium]